MFSFWEEVNFLINKWIKKSLPDWVVIFFRKELNFFRWVIGIINICGLAKSWRHPQGRKYFQWMGPIWEQLHH